MSCNSCKYFDSKEIQESMKGLCKRFPPAVHQETQVSLWPVVNQLDHCGEYKDRYKGQVDTWR